MCPKKPTVARCWTIVGWVASGCLLGRASLTIDRAASDAVAFGRVHRNEGHLLHRLQFSGRQQRQWSCQRPANKLQRRCGRRDHASSVDPSSPHGESVAVLNGRDLVQQSLRGRFPPQPLEAVGRRNDVPVHAHSRPLLDDRRAGASVACSASGCLRSIARRLPGRSART